jgi:Sulfate permease family
MWHEWPTRWLGLLADFNGISQKPEEPGATGVPTALGACPDPRHSVNGTSAPSTEPGLGRITRPRNDALERGWRRWIPGIGMLRRYEWIWLRHDVVAGLVLTTMLVPVGVAYAQASGVPGIYGLYATIIPLLAYALFGPSRILVLGRTPRSPPSSSPSSCRFPVAIRCAPSPWLA